MVLNEFWSPTSLAASELIMFAACSLCGWFANKFVVNVLPVARRPELSKLNRLECCGPNSHTHTYPRSGSSQGQRFHTTWRLSAIEIFLGFFDRKMRGHSKRKTAACLKSLHIFICHMGLSVYSTPVRQSSHAGRLSRALLHMIMSARAPSFYSLWRWSI